MLKNIKTLLLVSLAVVACNKNDDTTTAVADTNSSDGKALTAGTANFSKYVAVGNSLSAGFSDGALFKAGQLGSWTNVLNEQFKLVGGGEFKIPFMPDDNIGGIVLPQPFFQNPRLFWNNTLINGTLDQKGPTPVGFPTSQATDRAVGSGFNNMGVPGAKVFHLLAPNYGNPAGLPAAANPYFCRFASTPSARIIDDATAQNATFFSLWIGNNDVLSYATSGGTGTNQTGNFNPATYGSNDITDPNVFAGAYNSILNGSTTPVVAKGLTSDGAKGVVCNIPYVTSVPYFTAIPVNAITADKLPIANANSLNQLFGAINQIAAGANQSKRFNTLNSDFGNANTVVAPNALLIVDEALVDLSAPIATALTPLYGATTAGYLGSIYGKARHAVATGNRDYILLTTRSIITPPPSGNNIRAGAPAPFNVNGISYPLQDSEVLTSAETAEIKIATDAYNVTIKSLATAKGLAFVDTNAILAQIANGGLIYNGYNVTSDYPIGGAFSLDGVHPSARGYAVIANKVMEAINATYGSNLKAVDVTKYRIQYPRSF
ncbi:MAG: G-D-S-L family lipolytic protein [Flavobacterium sp.]|nr:G-D-S-L family lipolytic protein [Flavobacterium sp.]